ncbi:ABC-three component system middle component 6 [Rugamonas apoptosis]|uniref:ABC-three component system middle component 6 n=1 Tax=Rugamonas apoptosis TaxID=2758570 RepID=UPI0035CCDE82
MIPNTGCDPQINVVRIGAHLLKSLFKEARDVDELLMNSSAELGVSVDHIILSLDWLFAISAIKYSDNRIMKI